MSTALATIAALRTKGYEVEASQTGAVIRVEALDPNGELCVFNGTAHDLTNWANQRPYFEPRQSEAEWDAEHAGMMTQADVEEALALEEGTIEIPSAVIPLGPATVQAEAVPGLGAALMAFAQDKLEKVRKMGPQPVVLEPPLPEVIEIPPDMVPPPSPGSQHSGGAAPPVEAAPVNVRSTLVEAQKARRYVHINYTDARGDDTTRAVMPYAVTPTYLLAYCTTRKEMRRFFVENVSYAEPLRKAVKLPKHPELTVVPLTDLAAKRGMPQAVANPRNFVSAGNWVVYADVLAG